MLTYCTIRTVLTSKYKAPESSVVLECFLILNLMPKCGAQKSKHKQLLMKL